MPSWPRLYSAWNELDLGIAIFILLAYVVVDGMYAYYTLSVVKKQPFSAATTGFVMHFIIAFGVLNYVNNFLYVLPLAAGSWIGTYLVVEWERRTWQ